MTRYFYWLFAAVLALALAACSSAPTREVPANGVHVVQKGEFISQIARDYGLEWEELARINSIKPPYNLRVGQRLRLTEGTAHGSASPAGGSVGRSIDNEDVPTGAPIGNIPWQWPTEGKVVGTFKANDATRKGIDIEGEQGQPVLAAAAGEVAYSGAGLAGYGKLIIIRHDTHFLSAYAYNEKLLVSEGQKVNAGQAVAHMGLEQVGKPRLHFEIRLDGQPIDPLRQLPRRKSQ
jgi:lipoprotein NlpD